MESINNEHMIALDIAYKIMTHSYERLMLSMMHPGGEQYNCLALLTYDRQRFSPKLLITLNGSGIHEGNRTVTPYPELYKNNKADLMERIARQFEIRLCDSPVRGCPAVSYLMKILELDSVTVLSAWYDGSYHSKLEDDAMNFPYYMWKNEKDFNKHMPWWLIRANG
ncbi:MAG: hypothetical protein GXX92_00175, partial [Clostridiales bacterium]|nr:hypothetical protein [Clostridiales bacterium]